MRVLGPPPLAFRDPSTGEPAFGSFAGALPRVDLGALSFRDRFARRKRWVYAAVSADGVWLAFAVVRTGYAATSFAFAYDVRDRLMLLDRTVLGPAGAARIADDPSGDGEVAAFSFGKSVISLVRRDGELRVRMRADGLDLDAAIDLRSGPPSISAVVPLGDGLLDATEKRALLAARGRATVAGRTFSLDGGVAGYDYTHGLLPRHTQWKWAFAMGQTDAGAPIAFNVAEGFVGAAECAAFTEGGVHPLGEPRFAVDLEQPLEPWRLEGEGIELVFRPGAVHAQRTRLVVVRSCFLQPVGTFTGTIHLGNREVRLVDVPGVVEHQDVLW
jgi:hypothetical protein